MTDTLKMKEIARLLGNTPSPAHADARTRLQGFIEICQPFELRFVQRAVTMILNGEAEGVDPKFAIYPPMLATVCRQLRDKDLTRKATHKGAVLQIMDRTKEFHKDPVEVRRAAVAAGLARLSGLNKPEETPEQVAEREANRKAYTAEHDRHFLGNDTDEAKRKRLMGQKTR